MQLPRGFAFASLVALAACGEQTPTKPAWRLGEVVAAADAGKLAQAWAAAKQKHAPAATVVFDAGALAAVVAAKDTAPRVAIGVAPKQLAANETWVVPSSGAVAAVKLALLAARGKSLPPAIGVGAHIVTAANAAAGGDARPAPGDFALLMLEREHGDVITTAPRTDDLCVLDFVQWRSDAWHERVRDELQTEAKRFPQIQLRSHTVDGDAAALRRVFEGAAQAGARVVAVAADEWQAVAALQPFADEHQIKVIGIDPAARATGVAATVGADAAILGRNAADALMRALPAGGVFLEVRSSPGNPGDLVHQSLLDALALRSK